MITMGLDMMGGDFAPLGSGKRAAKMRVYELNYWNLPEDVFSAMPRRL
jgi:hypothetical protein